MVIAVSTPNSKLSSNGVNTVSNGKLRNNIFHNPKRPPLLPSEAENGHPRRFKSKEVASRYLSSSTSSSSSISISTTTSSSSNSSNSMTSRRSASPMVARTVPTTPMTSLQNSSRRSQSAERRRPVTPRAGSGEISNASKLLMTSTRGLSMSFNGESFSMSKSKAKPSPATSGLATVRKGTTQRRIATPVSDQRVNLTSKLSDQHRWPARSRPSNSSFLTRSLDFGAAAEKARVSGSSGGAKAIQKSMTEDNKRNITGTKLDSNLKNIELKKNVDLVPRTNSAVSSVSEAAASDSDSMSSGSTTSSQEYGSVAHLRRGPRGIVVPARVWQETTNRLQRGSEAGSPVVKNNVSKLGCASRLIGTKKYLNDVPVSSSRVVSSGRGLCSPLRGAVRPASPSKVFTSSISSPARGMLSPMRMRNGAASMNDVCSTPSILSFAADVRRGKMGENRILDAHELRMLYNRYLQWRFMNARAEASLTVQTEVAERSLYNAWVSTSKLRHLVKSKRIEVQLLSHNLKLHSILNRQVPSLENWDIIERDHRNSLLGAIEALEASIVRLPVVGGARADIQEMKNAISSAVDVMQTMGSSICSLLTKVEQVNTLISELASMATNECGLLSECKDLLSKLTAMEVKDCSLRVHILQLKRLPQSLMLELYN